MKGARRRSSAIAIGSLGRRVVRRVVDSRGTSADRLALLGGERLREAVRDPKLAARLAVGSEERHELGGAPPLLRAKVAALTARAYLRRVGGGRCANCAKLRAAAAAALAHAALQVDVDEHQVVESARRQQLHRLSPELHTCPICSSIPQVAGPVISQSSTWRTRGEGAAFVRDGDGSCMGRSDGVGSHLWMMWRSAASPPAS